MVWDSVHLQACCEVQRRQPSLNSTKLTDLIKSINLLRSPGHGPAFLKLAGMQSPLPPSSSTHFHGFAKIRMVWTTVWAQHPSFLSFWQWDLLAVLTTLMARVTSDYTSSVTRGFLSELEHAKAREKATLGALRFWLKKLPPYMQLPYNLDLRGPPCCFLSEHLQPKHQLHCATSAVMVEAWSSVAEMGRIRTKHSGTPGQVRQKHWNDPQGGSGIRREPQRCQQQRQVNKNNNFGSSWLARTHSQQTQISACFSDSYKES